MAKKNITEIVVILDRSSSMSVIRNDVIGGYNTFLESQKDLKSGKAYISLVQFDHEYEPVYFSKNIEDTPKLDTTTYVPRGSTSLLDAVGRTILDVEARIDSKKKKDKPNKVIILVITDGQENASLEFDKTRITDMIKEQELKGWTFMYLSADVNAFDDAHSLGISKDQTIFFDSTHEGTRKMYHTVTRSVSSYRTHGTTNIGYNDIDEK